MSAMIPDQIAAAHARLADAEDLRQDAWAIRSRGRVAGSLPLLRDAGLLQLHALAQACGEEIPSRLQLPEALGLLSESHPVRAAVMNAAQTLERVARAVRSPDPEETERPDARMDPEDPDLADAALSTITVWVAENLPPGLGIWDEPQEAPEPA